MKTKEIAISVGVGLFSVVALIAALAATTFVARLGSGNSVLFMLLLAVMGAVSLAVLVAPSIWVGRKYGRAFGIATALTALAVLAIIVFVVWSARFCCIVY